MKLGDQIKNRWTGEVMCGGLTLRVVLENHRKWRLSDGGERADLRDADLRDADLRDAYLRDADLSDANLRGANLRGADLRDADLRDANLRGAYLRDANLRGANLRGADLRDADLRDADLSDAYLSGAYLSGAYLSDAYLSGAPFKIKNIHQAVYEAASKEGALDMCDWHTCDTTHCRAGWVVHLAGDAGKALEWSMGTSAAAAMIYLASDPNRIVTGKQLDECS